MPANPYLDHLATPLGQMLIEFNTLEVDLGRLIARLVDQNEDWIAAIFAGELMFFPKVKLARALIRAKIASDDERYSYEEALKRCEAANVERNQYVHSEYLPFLGSDDELMEVLKTSLRKRAGWYEAGGDGREIDKLLQPVSETSLNALIEEIILLSREVRTLAERYCDNRPE